MVRVENIRQAQVSCQYHYYRCFDREEIRDLFSRLSADLLDGGSRSSHQDKLDALSLLRLASEQIMESSNAQEGTG